MDSKEFAATGIRLPEIAVGTWKYHGGVEPLREAISLGAVFVDTAESYGTEEIVGEAIAGIRSQIFLASKVSPRHFRRADLIKAAEDSLRRLKTDHLDLYQLHWPNYTVPIAETMGAMEELITAGKVRFLGVSNFTAREIEEAQAGLSRAKIVSNQVRYSIVDRTIEDGLLQYCEARKIAVLAFSPLDNGLENMRPFDPEDRLGMIAAEAGKTKAQVALNWCTSRAPVTAIFKAERSQHVRENCGASGWRLSSDQMHTLNQIAFRRRGPMERSARRLARRVLQTFGRNL